MLGTSLLQDYLFSLQIIHTKTWIKITDCTWPEWKGNKFWILLHPYLINTDETLSQTCSLQVDAHESHTCISEITVILNPGLFPVWGRLFKRLVVMSKFMPIPAFSVCIYPLFEKLNIQFNFCVFLCVWRRLRQVKQMWSPPQSMCTAHHNLKRYIHYKNTYAKKLFKVWLFIHVSLYLRVCRPVNS